MEYTAFDEVLGLEESFYKDGYDQGYSDGVSAGQIEGRTFGLEKGFEKYVASGKLHGKALIWANRLPSIASQATQSTEGKHDNRGTQATGQKYVIPKMPDSGRLVKHIKVLYALAESESLSTENTEDAVSDFDDRLNRAQAKAKVIERLSGDAQGSADGSTPVVNMEDGSMRM
ncbi:hypothetical protein BJ878DRAFT_137559 [Calycina marina]|uniref:Essential protein Yae1 N-terminal domain-containing protein n=1 Tax=Calycina marina TaxID=1763456 RepID=A0A9P7Z0G8_9HELO|nr:hypothetical protein BJ878DRAFT_137559 [Calycina marina]